MDHTDESEVAMNRLFCVIGALLLPALATATIHQIDIGDLYFSPLKTKVAPGDTVRWVLVSGAHSTTSNNASGMNPKFWDSGTMSTPGQTFDVVFTAGDGPGPFPYYCTEHIQTMVDTIFWDSCYATGDVNNDGITLSVADIVELVRVVKRMVPMPPDPWDLDMNGDCAIDDGDIETYTCFINNGMICFPDHRYPVLTCCTPDTVVGASCIGDSCSLRTEANCLAMGGTYYGDGTRCSGVMPCCCKGIRGNLDGDPEDKVDISDLSIFIDFLFNGVPFTGTCEGEQNVDGIGEADISDLTALTGYLFENGILPSCTQ
jgi:plastocyanin